jgi:REP element-mobilizing transposase RayT
MIPSPEGDVLAHSFARVTLHVVFSTKGRRNLIAQAKLQEVFNYIIGIARNKKVPLLAAGGMSNHIHLLLGLPWNMTYPEVISKIKANSSRFIRKTNRNFAWQEGYGAFAVSMSQVDTVVQYIRNQAEHHKRRSFEEEFMLLLKKAKIEFDPATIFE